MKTRHLATTDNWLSRCWLLLSVVRVVAFFSTVCWPQQKPAAASLNHHVLQLKLVGWESVNRPLFYKTWLLVSNQKVALSLCNVLSLLEKSAGNAIHHLLIQLLKVDINFVQSHVHSRNLQKNSFQSLVCWSRNPVILQKQLAKQSKSFVADLLSLVRKLGSDDISVQWTTLPH